MADSYEEALEVLRTEYRVPDDVLSALEGTGLRTELKEARKEIDRLKPFEAKVIQAEKAPTVLEAFRQQGVDIDGLRPLERKAIESFKVEGDEIDLAAVKATIAENDLPLQEGFEPDAQTADDGTGSGAAAIAGHAQTVGTRTATRSKLAPQDTAEWSTEKLLAFKDKYPDEFEQLKAGEEVTLPGPVPA